MSPLHALILGLVEGLTEFLPVSSTGHLILVAHALGYAEDDPSIQAFEVVIQLGALIAVLVHYRALLAMRTAGLFSKDPKSIRLALCLIVGFVPIGFAGLFLRKIVKQYLFGPTTVAGALLVGGVIMIVMGVLESRKVIAEGETSIDTITPYRALIIGLGQCLALIPGTSRSMATIITGRLVGLSTATAAEFSFLLAIPTLGAATVYELIKSRHELLSMPGGPVALSIGLLVSFVSAWAVIASFLGVLRRFGLAPWGVYRIVIALVVLAVLR